MKNLKKLFLVPVILGTVVLVPVAAEASTAGAERSVLVSESSTLNVQPRGRWNRRPRVVTRTRIRTVGFRRYRETVRITYLPNGRTRTQVISRVRIR
jgi:hypothetical protein